MGDGPCSGSLVSEGAAKSARCARTGSTSADSKVRVSANYIVKQGNRIEKAPNGW